MIFINNNNGYTTYDDPRLSGFTQGYLSSLLSLFMRSSSNIIIQVTTTTTLEPQPVPQSIPIQQPLPLGWEQRLDQQGRPYFIDHINKYSTYADPRQAMVMPQQPIPVIDPSIQTSKPVYTPPPVTPPIQANFYPQELPYAPPYNFHNPSAPPMDTQPQSLYPILNYDIQPPPYSPPGYKD
jgi:hypothetical protein